MLPQEMGCGSGSACVLASNASLSSTRRS
ncbi:Mobile element protein (plasmid) [Ralstonia solanacearum]|nr:Mobile element protein [Ralstonia solanacearum]